MSIHAKNQSSKISCYSPFNRVRHDLYMQHVYSVHPHGVYTCTCTQVETRDHRRHSLTVWASSVVEFLPWVGNSGGQKFGPTCSNVLTIVIMLVFGICATNSISGPVPLIYFLSGNTVLFSGPVLPCPMYIPVGQSLQSQECINWRGHPLGWRVEGGTPVSGNVHVWLS